MVRWVVVAMAAVAMLGSHGHAASPSAASTEVRNAPSVLDTPVVDLILDARTEKVIRRRMPAFMARMDADPEFVEMIGRATLVELAADPHVDGLTAEALERLRAELHAAQADAPPP